MLDLQIQVSQLASRIASALLLQYGELSVRDIEALPLVSSREEADKIVGFLMSNFEVELSSRKMASYPFVKWEEVVKLKSNVALQ